MNNKKSKLLTFFCLKKIMIFNNVIRQNPKRHLLNKGADIVYAQAIKNGLLELGLSEDDPRFEKILKEAKKSDLKRKLITLVGDIMFLASCYFLFQYYFVAGEVEVMPLSIKICIGVFFLPIISAIYFKLVDATITRMKIKKNLKSLDVD